MSCLNKLSQWLIIIPNLCTIICCVVAVIILHVKEIEKKWSKINNNDIPFIFILIAMSLIMVSSIMGFILCNNENKCLYISYMIIIIIIFIIEMIAIVISFCYQDNIIDQIEDNWGKSKYNEVRIEIEIKYECCGFKTSNISYKCGYDAEIEPSAICYNKIIKELSEYILWLRISGIMMAILELFFLICIVYLICCKKKKVNNL